MKAVIHKTGEIGEVLGIEKRDGIDGETVLEWWEYSYNIHALQADYDSEIGRRELRNISLYAWCEGVPMPYLPEEIVKMQQKLLSK